MRTAAAYHYVLLISTSKRAKSKGTFSTSLVIEEMLLMNYAERAYTGHRSEERMHKHPPALHKERFVKKKEQKGRPYYT
jgi:hypothetical protein